MHRGKIIGYGTEGHGFDFAKSKCVPFRTKKGEGVEKRGMGCASFPTAPTTIRLQATFTFTLVYKSGLII